MLRSCRARLNLSDFFSVFIAHELELTVPAGNEPEVQVSKRGAVYQLYVQNWREQEIKLNTQSQVYSALVLRASNHLRNDSAIVDCSVPLLLCIARLKSLLEISGHRLTIQNITVMTSSA